ncbi:YbjN domain-containing protein [Rugosimonospora africana]|uniref:YbjN domain-containing protein n=1 Tax=Rugosimonospora africana TaxID=556532 RepID=UPI001940DB49|nr:YbjN domain-containing protein [Rugosimonospora africana]
MPWWPKRGGQAGDGASSASGGDVDLRVELPAQRAPEPAETLVAAVDMARLGAALDRLEIRYLTDGDGSLLAMWERHAVLFTLEGPDDEILVIRARPHGTVPPDWADRAYRVVNEWNHSRRFCKAYVGDPTERGQLPIYAEMQVPLISGAHDALLVELIDCAAAVAVAFVDWIHDEGGLL